jgi:hypothetical protein
MNMAQIRERIRRAYGSPRAVAIRQPANADERAIGGAQVWGLNANKRWYWIGSFGEVCKALDITLIPQGIESVRYHRGPTSSELRFGEGAIHYADFSIEDCCHEGTRLARQWFVSPFDGLRYYR